jgi:tripartite-type tricarboxylate transporter receptor subunit TctC
LLPSPVCGRGGNTILCILCILCVVFVSLFVIISASAQQYPTKPLRLIIPFPPGGSRDVQARLIGPKFTEAWGQPVVIDNRAGANGIIGLELAAKSPADGHTLVMISAGFAAAPSLYAKLPYDTLRDFVPVAPLTSGPGLLVVNNTLPVKSVKEFIAYVRTRPGQLHYGSAGNGAPSHLAVELFKTMTQTQLTHVPYKGMAPALTDVIGGQIQVSLPTIPGGLPHAQAGRVRALGVSGAQRSPAAPEVPTIAEAGVPGYEASNWYGIAVPAGVPRAIVAALNKETTRIVTLPDVRARLLNLGMEPQTSMPDAYVNYLKSEVEKWGRVVKSSGIRMD